MALSTKELWMDFHNQNITRLCVVQNEKDTRKYNVHFCDDGIPIQLNATDYELLIAEKKADGNKVLKACTINSDGTGLLVFDENMCISNGSASLQFILRNKKDNSWTRTIAFNARIHEAVLNNGDITSSTEFDVLSNLIVKVEELDKLVTDNEKIRQANEETRKINETKRINAENTRIGNENTRKQNETARTNAESERVKNENTRITNEKIRQTQETKRQNDTATAITNANNAAKNANDKANDLQNKLDNHHFVLTNELENSVSSTSTTHAPTANAVKTVYDKAVSVENTINSNKNNWNDKYTKNEIDNKFSTLENNIDWKESVATFSDIAKTYPNPEDGWTVNVKDTDYTYRYSGDKWVAISANAIPKATQSVDGLLTKEDKTSYDDANSKKHTHSNKSVLDGITSAFVNTWNKVTDKLDKTGDASNTTNTITTATTRTNLTTGEKLSVSLGKIAKFFADLKTVAFTGNYNDLSNKPSIGNGTITIKQAGTNKGTFTMNQGGNTTIELTDSNTTYSNATTSTAGLMSPDDKTALNNLKTGAVTGVKGNAESTYRTGNVNLTPANIGALATTGGTLTGGLKIISSQKGYVNIFADKEGGNIQIQAPNGKVYEIDSYNSDVLRIYASDDNGNNKFAYFNRNTGALSADGGFDGNAKSASKANELIAIDITGKTIDVNTLTLSTGTIDNALYVERTCGGAANIKNIPVTNEPFKLYVDLVRWASTIDYITKQTFVSSRTASTYERWCANGAWTSWLPNTRFTTNPTSGQVLIADNVNGGIKTSGYTIASSVPANAKFTDTNTTYVVATQSANGLLSATDKKKLDGIASGANAYSHPTSAGNKHIPSGGSSGQILRWSADGTAVWGSDNNTTYSNFVKSGTGAKAGLVPAPSTTAGTTKYLREDGTWQIPPNTNTWRGIQNSLSSTSTTDSLSAAQGRALANGSARDNTKLPLSGGTLDGTSPWLDINKNGEKYFSMYCDTNSYKKLILRWRANGHWCHLTPLAVTQDTSYFLPNASGTISLAASSSKRIKKNITDVRDEEVSKIFKLNVKSFDYINEERGINQCGLIAEEVSEILPQIVVGDVNCADDDYDGIRQIGIDYAKLVPYLLKEVQNQRKEIDELKAAIIKNNLM